MQESTIDYVIEALQRVQGLSNNADGSNVDLAIKRAVFPS